MQDGFAVEAGQAGSTVNEDSEGSRLHITASATEGITNRDYDQRQGRPAQCLPFNIPKPNTISTK
jgi:hypothetical protein